jgi:hypothetical protein
MHTQLHVKLTISACEHCMQLGVPDCMGLGPGTHSQGRPIRHFNLDQTLQPTLNLSSCFKGIQALEGRGGQAGGCCE